MDVRELKYETENLPNIEILTSRLQKGVMQLKKNLGECSSLTPDTRKRMDVNLRQLQTAISDAKYGQIVNDKLASLSHYLWELRIGVATDDKKKIRRALSMFLSDPHHKVKGLVADMSLCQSQLTMIESSYDFILTELARELPLEHSVSMVESKPISILKELRGAREKQKTLAKSIGDNFITTARKLRLREIGKS